MKTVRISRSNFPSNGMFSWMNYFRWIMEKKYNIIIDGLAPEIVFYTNFFNSGRNIDHYTGQLDRPDNEHDCHVKKIFITGEQFDEGSYRSILERNENNYVLGFCDIDHPRYLKFPTYVLDSWVLFNESRIFDEQFSWLTKKNDASTLIQNYKRFCSVVQASNNPDRGNMFDLLSQYKPIKSSGPWRPTVIENEKPEKNLYLKPEYYGRVDGLTYRSKIEFFRDCKFNLAFQYTNTPHLTQEKIIHAFAADTIPIFYGNEFITNDFNPESFVNVHDYTSFEEATEAVKSIDSDDVKLKNMLEAPKFYNNQLPEYYNSERMLSFFESIINAI